MGEPKIGALGAALAISLAVHVGTALALILSPAPDTAVAPLASVEIDFTLEAPPPPPTPPPTEPDPVVTPEPIVDAERTRPALASLVIPRSNASETIIAPAIASSVELPSVDDDDDDDDDRDDRDDEHRRLMVSLDPRAVAAAAMIFDDANPIDRGTPGGHGTGRDSHPDARAMAREIDGALSAAANARPHVSHRGSPELAARTDGTYVFHGHAFSAVIQRDGTVQFNDSADIAMNAPSLTQPNGMVPSGTFDLTDTVMRSRGQDPYRHEREWFMRETEELRDRLGDEARARESRGGLSRMRRDLRRLWDGAGVARIKRARLFEMWDDCAEDEQGRVAREAICSFIRENLPEGGGDAYGEAELSALNRDRVSRERFSPYR